LGIKTRALTLLEGITASGGGARLVAGGLAGALRACRPRGGVALRNMEIALPSLSERERRDLLARFYRHFAWSTVECLRLGRAPAEAPGCFAPSDAEERLFALVREGGGVLFLTAHIGNWEALAAWLADRLASRGREMAAIVRDPDDPEEAAILEARRRRFGLIPFDRTVPMTRVAGFLRRGGFLGILADQHGGHEGVPVPFFGTLTSSAVGPGALALSARVPLIPIWSERVGPFRHRVRFGDPLPVERLASREETLRKAAEASNRAIEAMVRSAPEQWFWLHKRFKERGYGGPPPGGRPPAA